MFRNALLIGLCSISPTTAIAATNLDCVTAKTSPTEVRQVEGWIALAEAHSGPPSSAEAVALEKAVGNRVEQCAIINDWSDQAGHEATAYLEAVMDL